MIQLTLKTIADFEGQGPMLNVELHQDGERTHVTGIELPYKEFTLSPINLLALALQRLDDELPIPF